MLVIKKIDSCPSKSFKLLRIWRIKKIIKVISRSNFCNSSWICSQ